MKILITNDDGINSRGLKELVKGVAVDHDVYVAAPEREYTGYGGAVTFDGLIGVKEEKLGLGEIKSYKIYGTPSDCVIMALDELVGEVDIVLSGINNEPNIGDDIRFSGTLGACREAAFSGVPSLGISIGYGRDKKHYLPAVNFITHLLQHWSALYISITPLNRDNTDIKTLKKIKNLYLWK